MSHGVFVTAITCMDGRIQEPVSGWLKKRFHADYVDTITEPCIDGIFSRSQYTIMDSIRRRAEISVNAHGSRVLALVSHHDCAGNPVDRDQHLRDLACSLRYVQGWNLPVRVVGLFVNEHWEVELISDSGGNA